MSEEVKKAVQAIVEEVTDDPVKAAFLAGMKAERELKELTKKQEEAEADES